MHFAFVTVLPLLLSAVGLHATAQERYTPSADGAEVTDSRTGLIWRRCAEGMTWSKTTCTGKATFGNQRQAAALATAQATNSNAWRLPTLQELNTLLAVREIDVGKAAIDPKAFPATPIARYWTSTSVGPSYFMVVGFGEGHSGEGERNSPGATRLVRSAKPGFGLTRYLPQTPSSRPRAGIYTSLGTLQNAGVWIAARRPQ
jgi:hypothetical protein